MTQDQINLWILEFSHVEKDYKEEWDAFRYQLADKMFAMLGTNKEGTPILTLKLPPQEGAFYREEFAYISPGYYMNKVHWISIAYEAADEAIVKDLIEKSYTSFYASLPLKIRTSWE